MDYHSVMVAGNFLFILAITPTAAGILIFTASILLILSFLVSGSEIAFFALTPKDINLLKSRRQPSFRRIVYLLEHPRHLHAAMLIANSFVNIGIILIAHILLDNWFKDLPLTAWGSFFIKVLVCMRREVNMKISFLFRCVNRVAPCNK